MKRLELAGPLPVDDSVARLSPDLPPNLRERAIREFERVRDRHAAGLTRWYMNEVYVVIVDFAPEENGLALEPGWWHISIRRQDRQPVTDWREVQEIKNQTVGLEREAIQLFPAESRLMDSANQYHLWARAAISDRFRVGWLGRHVDDDPASAAMFGAQQRPIDRGERRREEKRLGARR